MELSCVVPMEGTIIDDLTIPHEPISDTVPMEGTIINLCDPCNMSAAASMIGANGRHNNQKFKLSKSYLDDTLCR